MRSRSPNGISMAHRQNAVRLKPRKRAERCSQTSLHVQHIASAPSMGGNGIICILGAYVWFYISTGNRLPVFIILELFLFFVEQLNPITK